MTGQGAPRQDELHSLPASWGWGRIDDVADMVTEGCDPRRSPEALHLAPDNIESSTGRLLSCRTVAEDLVVSNNFRFLKGDVLYTKLRPYLNKVVVAPFDGLCSSDILPIRARFNGSFLRYWMLSPEFLAQAIPRQTGVTLPRISRTALREVHVPVAPLPEQGRIVEAIETRFARLDAAVRALERARANLRGFQSSVLRTVFQQIQSSSQQGESIQQERWRPDWPACTVGDILRESLRNGVTTRPSSGDTGVRTLTLTAVTTGDFSIGNTKSSGIPEEDAEGLWLEPGDILIERSNTRELVGTSALYRGAERFAIYPDMVIRARVKNNVAPDFVAYVLKAPLTRKYFQSKARGVAGNMPKIAQPTILGLTIPIPSLEVQLAVVEEIDRKLSVMERTRRQIEDALTRCAHVRRSTLYAAFKGRLVPQDPKDEPASALLERIKTANQAASKPVRRARRLLLAE